MFVLASCRHWLQVSHLIHDWLLCCPQLNTKFTALSCTTAAIGILYIFKEIFNSSCKKTAHKHGFTTASAGPHMYNYIRVHTNHQTLSRMQTDAHKHKKSYLWVWFLHTQINARVAKKMMARSLRLLWRNTPTSLLSLCVLAHPWPPKAAWGLQFYGLNRVSLCLLFAPNPAECLRWTSTILHS